MVESSAMSAPSETMITGRIVTLITNVANVVAELLINGNILFCLQSSSMYRSIFKILSSIITIIITTVASSIVISVALDVQTPKRLALALAAQADGGKKRPSEV